jgi:CRP-like cAMP-binding protein
MADYVLEIFKKTVKQLSSLPDDEIENVISHGIIREYSTNEYFLYAGEMSRNIGFIIEGLFRIYYIDMEGNEYTKNFKSSGQFMASMAALLLDAPSKLNIQALEPSKLICLNYDNILQLAEQNILWQKLLRKSTEIDYLEKEKRESDLLYFDVKERYLNFIKEHPNWTERIQQQYIASYLGMTPETLSRIRSKTIYNK